MRVDAEGHLAARLYRAGHLRRRAVRYARGALLTARLGGRPLRVKIGSGVRLDRHHPGTTLLLAPGVHLHDGVRIFLDGPGARVEIGRDTYLNRRTEVMCKQSVTIGRDCAVAWDVRILDTDYHELDGRPQSRPVHIGDHVWIGFGAAVLKGVTVGDGAVVAAGSLVTSDVPAGALVAGRPARVVRQGVTWV